MTGARSLTCQGMEGSNVLNAQKSKSGLDLDVPRSGRAADAYEVACTAVMLRDRAPERLDADGPTKTDPPLMSARHATALHVISGRLHRLAERQCNEDLTCAKCRGEGGSNMSTCRACAGSGLTIGRTLARLERQATEIAAHYGCRAYFQGDPRGCALYLVPGEIVPNAGGELDRYAYGKPTPFAMLQERWIEAHYTRGHAVSRLGR